MEKYYNNFIKAIEATVLFFVFLNLTQLNAIKPLLDFSLADFTKSPLPPYRDSIARSIGSAAIYFSIIEGETPYSARIDAPKHLFELSKSWYAPYFLLDRKLVVNCPDCEYKIIESPDISEATNSAVTHPLKIIKK